MNLNSVNEVNEKMNNLGNVDLDLDKNKENDKENLGIEVDIKSVSEEDISIEDNNKDGHLNCLLDY